MTLLVEPIPKARARTVVRGGKVMSYTPKATADAEAQIRQLVAQNGEFYPAGVPLSVRTLFVITKPSSLPKRRTRPITRPDIDNYVKLLCDALNGYLFADDSQICHLEAEKVYGQPPRIEIDITEAC